MPQVLQLASCKCPMYQFQCNKCRVNADNGAITKCEAHQDVPRDCSKRICLQLLLIEGCSLTDIDNCALAKADKVLDKCRSAQSPEDWSLFEDVFIIGTGKRQAGPHKNKTMDLVTDMFTDKIQFNVTWSAMRAAVALRQHLRDEGKWGAPYIPGQH